MEKRDLKFGVVYKYDGVGDGDGANILFTVVEDGSFVYKGCIVVHWQGNKVNIPCKGFSLNEHLLSNISKASSQATAYYEACEKYGKDVGGFTWHDSNKN